MARVGGGCASVQFAGWPRHHHLTRVCGAVGILRSMMELGACWSVDRHSSVTCAPTSTRTTGSASSRHHVITSSTIVTDWFRVIFIMSLPCAVLIVVNTLLIGAIRTANARRQQLLRTQRAVAVAAENDRTTMMLVTTPRPRPRPQPHQTTTIPRPHQTTTTPP